MAQDCLSVSSPTHDLLTTMRLRSREVSQRHGLVCIAQPEPDSGRSSAWVLKDHISLGDCRSPKLPSAGYFVIPHSDHDAVRAKVLVYNSDITSSDLPMITARRAKIGRSNPGIRHRRIRTHGTAAFATTLNTPSNYKLNNPNQTPGRSIPRIVAP